MGFHVGLRRGVDSIESEKHYIGPMGPGQELTFKAHIVPQYAQLCRSNGSTYIAARVIAYLKHPHFVMLEQMYL